MSTPIAAASGRWLPGRAPDWRDPRPVHPIDSRPGHCRPAFPSRPDAIPGSGAGRTMGLRHRSGLYADGRAVLAGSVRLAETGSRAERLPAVHGADAGCRPALPPRAGAGAFADAVAADARVAG